MIIIIILFYLKWLEFLSNSLPIVIFYYFVFLQVAFRLVNNVDKTLR
jgi:hypothetical protein